MIRLLDPSEKLPWRLLLLADEAKEVIDKYIFDCEIYLYELNHQPIAVYALQPLTETEIEIKNIAVDIPFQRKGIGRELLRHAAGNAANRGFEWLLIGTADTSEIPLRLYKSEGFTPYTTISDFFIDNYPEPIYENGRQVKDMIVLRKSLPQRI